jgi:hypothetical protein
MYEKECDILLQFIEDEQFKALENPECSVAHTTISQKSLGLNVFFDVLISILISNEHVYVIDMGSGKLFYKVSHKGRTFLATTSYVQRKEELDLQRKTNVHNIRKLEQDLKLNNWLLKTKWLPHILALAGLIISILAYNESRKERSLVPNNTTEINSVKK